MPLYDCYEDGSWEMHNNFDNVVIICNIYKGKK
jgi:hypothetical protein